LLLERPRGEQVWPSSRHLVKFAIWLGHGLSWLGHERHRGIVSALSDELGDFVLGIAQAGLRVTKKPLMSETVVNSSFSVGLLEGMAFHKAVQDSTAEQKSMLFHRADKLLKNLERKRISMPWKKL
jgi:hypothetical protein